EKNDLAHVWQDGQANPEFAARVAQAELPGPVHALTRPGGAEVAARLQWLRDGQPFDGRRHAGAYRHPFPHPPRRYPADRPRRKLDERFVRARERTVRKLAEQKAQIDALSVRLRELERRTLKSRAQRAYRKLT